MNGAIWSRGRWSLHLLHLNKAFRDSLDGAQASMLRRLAKIPHPYISRVSNATTRRRCKATRFSIQILRSQLRWLGHILRREPTDPLRLVVFEPNTALLPRLTGTGRIKVVGRPRIDWAQTLIEIFCNLNFPRRKNWTSIQSLIHFHDANTGFIISLHNCSLNWCSAAPTWQKRCVDIYTTAFRR